MGLADLLGEMTLDDDPPPAAVAASTGGKGVASTMVGAHK